MDRVMGAHGHFSLSMEWLDAIPPRSELSFSQACDLLRLALPDGADEAHRLLSDVHLIGANEIAKWRNRAEHSQITSAAAVRATTATWRVVREAGKRKTLRTDDVRAALTEAAS